MFQELQQKALDYLDEIDPPESFLNEIYQKAMQNKAGFEAFLPSVGLGLDSTYSIFIEAIWTGDENGTVWEDFYLREMKRVVNAADAGNQDAQLIDSILITCICCIDHSFHFS